MKKTLLWFLLFAALVMGVQACEAAYADTPYRIRVVVEQAGDSARIIVSWTPSRVGTNPIAHYHVRLVYAGSEADSGELIWSQATATVDTVYRQWSQPGTLYRLGVQAEDSDGHRSICDATAPPSCTAGFNWSGAFELVAPFYPPGLPGAPTLVIDTSTVIALEMFRILPDSMPLIEGFGTAVLEGRFYASGMVVACTKALITENPIDVVGMGLCDIPVVPTDSLYDPHMFDFTTADELTDGLRWSIIQR